MSSLIFLISFQGMTDWNLVAFCLTTLIVFWPACWLADKVACFIIPRNRSI